MAFSENESTGRAGAVGTQPGLEVSAGTPVPRALALLGHWAGKELLGEGGKGMGEGGVPQGSVRRFPALEQLGRFLKLKEDGGPCAEALSWPSSGREEYSWSCWKSFYQLCPAAACRGCCFPASRPCFSLLTDRRP